MYTTHIVTRILKHKYIVLFCFFLLILGLILLIDHLTPSSSTESLSNQIINEFKAGKTVGSVELGYSDLEGLAGNIGKSVDQLSETELIQYKNYLDKLAELQNEGIKAGLISGETGTPQKLDQKLASKARSYLANSNNPALSGELLVFWQEIPDALKQAEQLKMQLTTLPISLSSHGTAINDINLTTDHNRVTYYAFTDLNPAVKIITDEFTATVWQLDLGLSSIVPVTGELPDQVIGYALVNLFKKSNLTPNNTDDLLYE